jgi:tRNA pseudouridine55 synthase
MDTTLNGLLVLDKLTGITSRQAVDRASRWFPRGTRIGHTGTLDPLATGVLVLCVGDATRLVEYVQDMSKSYHSCFRLGATSDSDDADGTVQPVSDAVPPSLDTLRETLKSFCGVIEQIPPTYSAARVSGQRAHQLARRGESVSLTARQVTIHNIELLRYDYPEVEVIVHCGKGTYIRSLARDLGTRLGCGGYVATLRRLRVGPFTPEQAVPLDADRQTARSRLLPLALALAELPRWTADTDQIARLRRGQSLALPPGFATHEEATAIGLFDAVGQVVGVGRLDAKSGLLRPVKMLASWTSRPVSRETP